MCSPCKSKMTSLTTTRTPTGPPSQSMQRLVCFLSLAAFCLCPVADSPRACCIAEFRSGKASDIISTLVSIYDSQDVIVKELQNLLAQKLLAVRDYDLEKEVRPLSRLEQTWRLTAYNPASPLSPDSDHRNPQAPVR